MTDETPDAASKDATEDVEAHASFRNANEPVDEDIEARRREQAPAEEAEVEVALVRRERFQELALQRLGLGGSHVEDRAERLRGSGVAGGEGVEASEAAEHDDAGGPGPDTRQCDEPLLQPRCR